MNHAEKREHLSQTQPLALDKLPEVCYTTLISSPCQVIAIKRGEMGYWPIHAPKPSAEAATKAAAELNGPMKPEQVLAMENGSMFGFHCPGADPDQCARDLVKHPRMAAEYAAKVSS